MKSKHDLSVSLWKLKVLGWVGVTIFTICMIGSFMSGQPITSVFFIPFILLSILPLLYSGIIYSNSKGISLKIPLGEYGMDWEEIERIERGQSQIGLVGGMKRLSIPTPEWWAGQDRTDLLNTILEFMDERGMEFQHSFLSDYKFSKNTKKHNKLEMATPRKPSD